MQKVKIILSILLVFAIQTTQGFSATNTKTTVKSFASDFNFSAHMKLENAPLTRCVNPDSFGNELELPGNLIAFSDSKQNVSVKCANGNSLAVLDYSLLIPANWSSYLTNLSIDSNENVVLKVYEPSNVEPFVVESTMVSIYIQSSAFLKACATGMSYPEMDDAFDIVSAPALQWEISPNPIIGSVFTVKMSKPFADIKPEISMYNRYGQLVKTFKIKSVESQFETTGIAEGLYIMKISNGIETNEKRIYIGKKQ
jgi:hypothetical protein